MNQKRSKAHHLHHPRYMMFFIILLIAVATLHAFMPLGKALIGGFDLAAGVFILSLAPKWFNSSPETIRKTAMRDDGGRFLLLTVTAVIVVVVTLAVGGLVTDKDDLTAGHIALLAITLLAGWTFTNLAFAIHYAHVFYDADTDGKDRGGLSFPGSLLPVFADFVHFSFVIGMTCQTADICLTSQTFRRVVTFHGLFAFIFNLGIMALMVNVIAGLH